MSTYIPPRGPDGKILPPGVDPAPTPPSAPPAAPATAADPLAGRRPLSEHLEPQAAAAPQASSRRTMGLVALATMLITVALIALAQSGPRTATPVATATPAVAAVAAPSTVAADAHTPTPATTPLPVAVIAYDAPAGSPIGALEPGRPYRPVARAGADWMQLEVNGSGLLWVRAADLGPLAADPPDTTPLPDAFPPTPTPSPTPVLPTATPWQPPPPVPTRDWSRQPCTSAEAVGRAESPDGVLLVESCISQADAERLLADLLAATAAAAP